jgi:hypothetical protein
MPAVHEGGTPSLQNNNGEEHGRAGSAALTAGARATRDNGEEHGRDGRATHGRAGSAALTAGARATRDKRKTGTGILPRCCGRCLSGLFTYSDNNEDVTAKHAKIAKATKHKNGTGGYGNGEELLPSVDNQPS